MLATIFYLFTFLIIYEKLITVFNLKKHLQFIKDNELDFQKYKNYDGELDSKRKSYLIYNCYILLSSVWIIIGILTSQWILFLILMLFNFLMLPFLKITKKTIFYDILVWVTSLIKIPFLIFLVLNHFHLKIDFYLLILKWFNLG